MAAEREEPEVVDERGEERVLAVCPPAFHVAAWRVTTLAACATARLWRQNAWRWPRCPAPL